jgi:hypothetical protein
VNCTARRSNPDRVRPSLVAAWSNARRPTRPILNAIIVRSLTVGLYYEPGLRKRRRAVRVANRRETSTGRAGAAEPRAPAEGGPTGRRPPDRLWVRHVGGHLRALWDDNKFGR